MYRTLNIIAEGKRNDAYCLQQLQLRRTAAAAGENGGGRMPYRTYVIRPLLRGLPERENRYESTYICGRRCDRK